MVHEEEFLRHGQDFNCMIINGNPAEMVLIHIITEGGDVNCISLTSSIGARLINHKLCCVSVLQYLLDNHTQTHYM